MEELKQTALQAAAAMGITQATVENYADATRGEEGFIVNMRGANLNLTKDVHETVQRHAVEKGTPMMSKVLPGSFKVYRRRN